MCLLLCVHWWHPMDARTSFPPRHTVHGFDLDAAMHGLATGPGPGTYSLVRSTPKGSWTVERLQMSGLQPHSRVWDTPGLLRDLAGVRPAHTREKRRLVAFWQCRARGCS